MIDLAKRIQATELMDEPGIRYEDFAQNLKEIAFLNEITWAYHPTLKALQFFWREKHRDPRRPFKILDIGSGYGDFLRKIYRWGEKKGIVVELTGVDRNPWAEKAARAVTPGEIPIRYSTSDFFDLPTEDRYHVILNSHLTHHLSEEEIIRILRWMTHEALYGWFINDLHRHWAAYYAIKYATRCFPFHRLSRNDGPVSVARSFTRKDWENLIRLSGINRQKSLIKWFWLFRYGVLYNA